MERRKLFKLGGLNYWNFLFFWCFIYHTQSHATLSEFWCLGAHSCKLFCSYHLVEFSTSTPQWLFFSILFWINEILSLLPASLDIVILCYVMIVKHYWVPKRHYMPRDFFIFVILNVSCMWKLWKEHNDVRK